MSEERKRNVISPNENETVSIPRATSANADATEAVTEISRQIGGGPFALVVLFVSDDYDREKLSSAMQSCFGESRVVACTTAGELSDAGYSAGGISAFALPAGDFSAEVGVLDDIQKIENRETQEAAKDLRRRLQSRVGSLGSKNTFAFLLVDGLSMREETLTSALYLSLGDIPLFGGSAGDGGRYSTTWIYVDGEWRSGRAVFSLIHTNREFQTFRTQHFEVSDEVLVVTAADPANRVVMEIDGEPAALAYAHHLGLEVADLSNEILACHPVVVQLGGEHFVRSIMSVSPDQSIRFACAIDQGVVLRLSRGVDMVENLRQSFAEVESRIGRPEVIVACDCLFRRVEALNKKLEPQLQELMAANNVIGFTSYGEQFNAAHVNQTLTGIAIGSRRAA